MKNKKDFLSLKDLTSQEILALLELTAKCKNKRETKGTQLKGKSIALVFQKPSNRTRVSFEVAVNHLGGNCIYLGPDEINLGVRETTEDVAKTLSRYVDGIVARTFTHQTVLDLAKYADVPIINGLSDFTHPCQGLTDIFSIKEKFGKLKGLTLAYIGDGNNVCNSLLIGCAKVGMNVNVGAPKGYEPTKEILDLIKPFTQKSGAKILVTNSPQQAATKADVIYADVWVSMGQEEETNKRLKDFDGYQINQELCKLANKNYIFMHCLPAHRGQEVTADVMDGKHSIVFDQAENRLHTQKAILLYLYNKAK